MKEEQTDLRDLRRDTLTASTNPSPGLDYLIRLDGTASGIEAQITLHYVPDKLVLASESLVQYLATLTGLSDLPLEDLSTMILNDFNNEIVPRWVCIRLEQKLANGVTHRTLLEDRQPNWSNPELLSQIERF